MNVGQLIAQLAKFDPSMPVVMQMTDEPPGDYEVGEVGTASYCRERPHESQPQCWPTTWHADQYRNCDPPQPVAFLYIDPPRRETIDAETDRAAIEISEERPMTNELPDVKIDRRGTPYFDGKLLPAFIDERGITVTPGGDGGVNRLTVTLLVGKVDIEDPTSEDGSR